MRSSYTRAIPVGSSGAVRPGQRPVLFALFTHLRTKLCLVSMRKSGASGRLSDASDQIACSGERSDPRSDHQPQRSEALFLPHCLVEK